MVWNGRCRVRAGLSMEVGSSILIRGRGRLQMSPQSVRKPFSGAIFKWIILYVSVLHFYLNKFNNHAFKDNYNFRKALHEISSQLIICVCVCVCVMIN